MKCQDLLLNIKTALCNIPFKGEILVASHTLTKV